MGPWEHPAAPPEGVLRLSERWTRALDESTLRSEMLRAIRRGELEPLDVTRIRPTPIKLESRRFVISVKAGPRLGRSRRVVVKGYWDDRARHVLENHRKLWDHGMGEDGDVGTARPLGLLDGLGAMAMEHLPGERPDRVDRGDAARKAEALARMHSCAAALTPAIDLGGAIESLTRAASRLEESEPELAHGAIEVADRARRLAPEVATARHTPVHGDLGNGAFLFSKRKVYLLDWDSSCRFDPAWDVGYHLSQLHRWQLTEKADTSASRACFMRAYLAAAGEPGCERRIRFFEAMVDVSKASMMLRAAKPGWRTAVPELVRSASKGLMRIS